MNLQIFKNNQFGEVRVAITENNEPIFCLADVCHALGIANHGNVKSRLNEKGIHSMDTPTKGGSQPMIYIDEGNLYKTTFQSRRPEAEEFQNWLCYEVAPSIRKHGAYMTKDVIEKALADPETLIQLATTIKEERKQKELYRQQSEEQKQIIQQNAPKVEYYEGVLRSTSTYTTTQIAKELGMSATSLNRKLHELKVQYKRHGTWVLYEKHQAEGYTDTITHHYIGKEEEEKTSMLTVWTEKGRLFIHSLLGSLNKSEDFSRFNFEPC